MSKDTKSLSPPTHQEMTQEAYTRRLVYLSKALVSIVKRVAWLPRAESPEALCPWCGVYRSGGHAADCDRQVALKMAEELMPFEYDQHYKAYLKKSEEENEVSKRSGTDLHYFPELHFPPQNLVGNDDDA